MATFKAYFKKEIIESIRQYRYIVLAVGFIFFAISGPIMLKLLPEIMKNQLKGDMAALSALFVVTKLSSMQGYIKDLFQIGNLFVVFTLCGTLSDELTTQKFVFPYAKGSLPAGIVISKALHYGLVVTVFTFIGFFTNYYYSDLLFKGDDVQLINVLVSAALTSLYFFFNVMLTMLFSSLIKKGIVSGIFVLAISYFSALLSDINGLGEFLPYKLLSSATLFTSVNTTKTIIAISIYCLILGFLIIYRMSKVEVV